MPIEEVLQLHDPANTLLLYAAVTGWRRQTMKATAFAALVLVLCVVLAHADVPRTMSYQGVLRDDVGNTVPDGPHSIEFDIYDIEVGGTVNCTGFRLPTSATSGHVLTSDASGNATWQTASAPSPPLESGKFDSNADYALLVDCNDAQLLQNGAYTAFRILANVIDSSVCYAYYLDGSLISKATLSSAVYYDFTVPTGGVPYHAEVILSRPWAGGAIARIDIISQNGRCGGIWHSSH